jgi:hypothetical protein
MNIGQMKGQVFLGGSCGSSTWRDEIAIPLLKAAGVTFYNPQVSENKWTPEMRYEDIKAKEDATLFLFVIDDQTRAVTSIGEVSYAVGQKKPLALAVMDIKENARIANRRLTNSEILDLNRGRIYIKDIALANNVPVFASVREAVHYSIDLVRALPQKLETANLSQILACVSYKNFTYKIEEIPNGFLVQARSEIVNTKTQKKEVMLGRQWYISKKADEAEVVRTIFKSVLTWEEHEVRELFKYKDKALFNPHIEL